MTLNQFIARIRNVRTTLIGVATWIGGGLMALNASIEGQPQNVELLIVLGILGLLAVNSSDGGW